ncbi:MAG: thiamine phosphate synthase [Candidatus Ancillula trichonymphae]|nr:thiamine phosphate synthase [Candidatus Ancillula trichonymphae]
MRFQYSKSALLTTRDSARSSKIPPHIKSRIAFVLAGHVFSTPSHQKIPGKGLNYLKEVVDCSPFDVIAVCGINNSNLNAIKSAGAAGLGQESQLGLKNLTLSLFCGTMLR